MCLQTNWAKPRIAKEDIIVYKILKYFPKNRKYKYLSPYRSFKYEFEKLYQTNLVREEMGWYNFRFRVENGFHAYYTKKAAKKQSIFEYDVIAKCTIPKGSEYYKSTDGYREIVSNQLIINKIIE